MVQQLGRSRVQNETQQDAVARGAAQAGGPLPFQPAPLGLPQAIGQRMTGGENDLITQLAQGLIQRTRRRSRGKGSAAEILANLFGIGR